MSTISSLPAVKGQTHVPQDYDGCTGLWGVGRKDQRSGGGEDGKDGEKENQPASRTKTQMTQHLPPPLPRPTSPHAPMLRPPQPPYPGRNGLAPHDVGLLGPRKMLFQRGIHTIGKHRRMEFWRLTCYIRVCTCRCTIMEIKKKSQL